ncbi:uncharacterized protein CDV56_103856 [Aspergillus thermomutatus]|uniref:J domain-containing protein n=1 Tax=Aspergillus thermomutatus TaxID=41047 RepID=A0A397GI31_ASPTH|nr:uncharacterized protein CDV56_103856 [Aspergillus thermomutatus]RHZ49106.1 hypothetical protein CDV56_103856 [Aspergillus thermomutatus]
MLSAPDIDPYAVLGVQKDATLAEIKSAHRKLVLKCHPDKVKDESQRSKAQDEFQRVQQAYELLSDETKRTKYDQKVRLAELRREMAREGSAGGSFPYSSPRGSGTSREYRDGRYYEERKPADAAFFEDELRYTEEPRPMSRKYDEFERRRPRTKTTEEKKKSKAVPLDNLRTAKDTARDSVKSTHSSRAKYRTKERRREAYEKYERAGPYYDSEGDSDDASDSSASSIYVKVKRPSESKRSRDSTSRKTKSTDSSRRAERARYDDDDDYSDAWDSKHEKLHTTAQDYILRSKAVPAESDRRHRSSRSPLRHHGYESADPEPSSRRPGRSSRSSREDVRPSTSRNGSYEHLEPQPRTYETKRPSMPTAATSPSIKVPSSTVRPSIQTSRSASSAQSQSRSRREPNRVEQVLLNMVRSSTKPRGVERYDSGYSSPGTPEMAPGDSPTKTSTRYKIKEQDTVVVEPVMPPPPTSSSRHSRAYSPPRAERLSTSTRSAPKPVRSSTTYAYTPEPSSRYESTRPSASRQSSTRLFGEVEYSTHPKDKDIKYAREIRPEHVIYTRDAYPRQHYDEYRQPPAPRRQSTYA